jgi:tRNA dimethylallyltransferase
MDMTETDPSACGVPWDEDATLRVQGGRVRYPEVGEPVALPSQQGDEACSNDLPVIFLVGPTAIGKSRAAIPIAHALETEILTADSTQVYRGMNIGTDKPKPEDRGGIPHRLIDLVEPDEAFNAGQYRRAALSEIARLHGEKRIPLVVGGTGLYVRTLASGLWQGPPADWVLRRRLMEEAATHGHGHLWARLDALDPDLASSLHPKDLNKIIRGLEVAALTGISLSEWHRRHRFRERPFPSIMIGLMMERPALYARINARVLREIDEGLVDETRALLNAGYGEDLNSMKALGYRQMTGYLKGRYGFDEAVRRLQRDTRHFAKRQMTWFRSDPTIHWLTIGEHESVSVIACRVLDHLRTLGIRTISPAHPEAAETASFPVSPARPELILHPPNPRSAETDRSPRGTSSFPVSPARPELILHPPNPRPAETDRSPRGTASFPSGAQVA